MAIVGSLLIDFLWLLVSAAALQPFYQQCTNHCPLQNRTVDGHLEVGCGPECEISQCLIGCALWERALEASCKTVCNGTQELLPPKELFCVMGCNDALNRYLQTLKDAYGVPPAPALVADTLTSTSLRLEWESKGYSNLSWLAQWRYEPSGSWEYARDQERGPGPTVLVSGLTPYTNYRFRIVVLSQEAELVSSEPSLVIGTLPGGPPTSPPGSLRATPTGPTQVSVTWAPGVFPNGPLLSYDLIIEELPSGYRAHKDIPASDMKHFYMFQSLTPSRNYSVSVAMRNAVGQGPQATTVVTTPPLSEVKEKEKTTLILGTRHSVLSQNGDMLDEPVELYSTTHRIRGVGHHVRKGIIFVSDSAGRVLSIKDHQVTVILDSDLTPHSLSVDWLNDQLYVLGQVGSRWEVARCQLDGTGVTVAVAGLATKPLHIHVDPYNGYLFWLIQGSPGGGLYRLDLTAISNGIKHETSPDLILNDPNLGAFTVDYTNFRILVSSHEKNTVLAVSLDGKETTNIRMNTAQPQFKNVISLAMAHGLFYWTNGYEVLTEEYHPGKDNYFHNVGSQSDNGYVSVGVDSVSAQPTPVPVNPPTCLQAVLGEGHATAAWAPPHLLGGQGKGAWQGWSYRLSIEWEGGGKTLDNINTTQVTMNGLRSSETVKLRVAAVTDSGLGPWSAAFTGRTLSSASPSLLWSASQGVLKSDPTGKNLTNLLHRQHFQDNRGRQHVTDIAWYRDVLYLVTNTSQVFIFNTTSKSHSKVRGLEVGSIAVDWIGERLYWSNPKQQLITRGHLNGSHQEPLPILTVAKELNIDALNAFIYWSTGHAVECARLNGKQRRTYYPAELFSGKQVMGLTLDVHKKSVYWIVRNYEGSTLFRAPMADDILPAKEIIPVKMALTQYPDIQGPLCYFDSRLLWLRDDRNAVIGDLNGTNSALLNSMSLTGLNMVTVVDASLHPLPEIEEEVSVIPNLIQLESLRVTGNFSHFYITWDPITNVNLGQVFYELKISHEEKKEITVEITQPSWHYPGEEVPAPYTELRLSIKALTYWGSSPRQSIILHSPESVPTQPLSPRAFVTNEPVDNTGFIKELEVVLRWGMPSSPNGKLVGYKILSWIDGSSSYLWVTPLQHIDSLEYRTRDVPKDSIVFFQVRACTKVGCSLPSAAVRVDTGRETPLPLLLMTEDGASLLDVDRMQAQLLTSHQEVIDVAYVGSSVYYLDNRGAIDLVTDRGEAKVVSLNNTGMAIVADWIGRFLYWSEKGEKHGASLIKRIDLSLYDHGIFDVKTIAERPNLVLHLQIDPTNRMLYWIEEKPNKFVYLMKCSVDDCTDPSYFFGNDETEKKNCDCPESPMPWPVFYLDTTQPKLFWIDAATGSLLVTDLDACHCHLILDNYYGRDAGLPPTSLTGDHQHIYWSNGTENKLYRISKSTFHHFENVSSQVVPELKKIISFGRHLQPLPDFDCLIPKPEESQAPTLAQKTSDSLTLDLGESVRPENCKRFSRATSIYIIYYGVIEPDGRCPCAEHLNYCYNMTAFSSKPHLTGLLPYTSYIVRVVEKNHYLDLVDMAPRISLPFVFRTAPGAPSPPEELSGIPLSPNVAEIRWEPPRLVNSWRLVRYEVIWWSRSLSKGVRHNGEQVVETKGESNETVSVRLQKLIPGQTYNISVRAYSENSETYSESSCINLTTFSEPPDLVLLKATPYTLNISWPADMNISTHSHEMEYMDVALGDYWQPVPLGSFDEEDEIYFLDNLKPKTMYTFRMRIEYVDIEPKEEYIWPQDSRFTFRTLGDRPSRPGRPVMQHLSSGVYQVAWEPSKDNGADITAYHLEGRHSHPSKRGVLNNTQAEEDAWTTYYNGTYNYWKMSNEMKGEKYIFRVKAQNSYGWSDYSESSTFDLSQTGARLVDSHDVTVVLWVLTPTAIFITLLLFICVLYRTQVNVKKVPVRADTELATLRELPRWSVQNTNALYSGSSPHTLPKLRRDQITLTKFLGSGAFGEVFEGLAIAILGSEGPTRVAVKTLRKGANVQEKAEFLKEAQLMSNFRHPHILQLLGVCLDNDPHFIIMELMEGGDLLSYLRSSRPLMRAWDLLSMCVDVARGCCYLEEMHFVHRDLACRNCLVSSRDPVNRVVKIGDFGLARDIYKNDYYRKEGEGLLPVRWMAPESLVDGVFTSQSDVWAFGVLLWEIMTLGQQPYPARNNLEVLHYVRGGGRLTQPTAASAEMYSLMTKCWSFNADERPTFKYCLDILVELKEKIPNVITPSMPEIVPTHEKREEGAPKYLELVYDDEGGYEVPRSLEQTPEDDKSSLEKLLPGYTNMSSGEVSPTR